MYKKQTENWFADRVKEPKKYDYISTLQTAISTRRIAADNAAMKTHVVRSPDDPRRIVPNL